MRYRELFEAKVSITIEEKLLYAAQEHLAAIEDDIARGVVERWLNGFTPRKQMYFTDAEAATLAFAVAKIRDQNMRTFVADWLYGLPMVSKEFKDPVWQHMCQHGDYPKAKTQRAGAWSVFERRYKPMESPDGTLTWNDIPVGTPENRIWTCVDGNTGNSTYVIPGRVSQGFGFVICEVPFPDSEYEKPGYKYM